MSDKPVGRDAQGRFPPGVSGNPLGHPKAILEVVKLARVHTSAALSRLVEIAETSKNHSAAVRACEVLLDRGWGKSIIPIALSDNTQTRRIDFSTLTPQERAVVRKFLQLQEEAEKDEEDNKP
jgi:hypothetical protein